MADYVFTVFMIGDRRVGKTTLLSKFLEASPSFASRRKELRGLTWKMRTFELDSKTITLLVWDPPKKEKFCTSICVGASGILLVYDVTSKESFQKALAWIRRVSKSQGADIAKMLIGTKSDCEHKRKVPVECGIKLAKEFGIKFMEISAKDGKKVDEVFKTLAHDIRLKSDRHVETCSFGVKIPLDSGPSNREMRQILRHSDDVSDTKSSYSSNVSSVDSEASKNQSKRLKFHLPPYLRLRGSKPSKGNRNFLLPLKPIQEGSGDIKKDKISRLDRNIYQKRENEISGVTVHEPICITDKQTIFIPSMSMDGYENPNRPYRDRNVTGMLANRHANSCPVFRNEEFTTDMLNDFDTSRSQITEVSEDSGFDSFEREALFEQSGGIASSDWTKLVQIQSEKTVLQENSSEVDSEGISFSLSDGSYTKRFVHQTGEGGKGVALLEILTRSQEGAIIGTDDNPVHFKINIGKRITHEKTHKVEGRDAAIITEIQTEDHLEAEFSLTATNLKIPTDNEERLLQEVASELTAFALELGSSDITGIAETNEKANLRDELADDVKFLAKEMQSDAKTLPLSKSGKMKQILRNTGSEPFQSKLMELADELADKTSIFETTTGDFSPSMDTYKASIEDKTRKADSVKSRYLTGNESLISVTNEVYVTEISEAGDTDTLSTFVDSKDTLDTYDYVSDVGSFKLEVKEILFSSEKMDHLAAGLDLSDAEGSAAGSIRRDTGMLISDGQCAQMESNTPIHENASNRNLRQELLRILDELQDTYDRSEIEKPSDYLDDKLVAVESANAELGSDLSEHVEYVFEESHAGPGEKESEMEERIRSDPGGPMKSITCILDEVKEANVAPTDDAGENPCTCNLPHDVSLISKPSEVLLNMESCVIGLPKVPIESSEDEEVIDRIAEVVEDESIRIDVSETEPELDLDQKVLMIANIIADSANEIAVAISETGCCEMDLARCIEAAAENISEEALRIVSDPGCDLKNVKSEIRTKVETLAALVASARYSFESIKRKLSETHSTRDQEEDVSDLGKSSQGKSESMYSQPMTFTTPESEGIDRSVADTLTISESTLYEASLAESEDTLDSCPTTVADSDQQDKHGTSFHRRSRGNTFAEIGINIKLTRDDFVLSQRDDSWKARKSVIFLDDVVNPFRGLRLRRQFADGDVGTKYADLSVRHEQLRQRMTGLRRAYDGLEAKFDKHLSVCRPRLLNLLQKNAQLKNS